MKRIRKSVKKPTLALTGKIKTIEIEEALARYFGFRENIIVPNISWGAGFDEVDLMVIKKTGYVIGVEIKISKSDLVAEKRKKHDHSDNRIKEFYYAIPKEMLDNCLSLIPEHFGVISCQRNEYRYNNGNKYPDGSVYCHTIREAQTNKNSRKLTDKEIINIGRLGAMRIWSGKRKIIDLQNQIKELNSLI